MADYFARRHPLLSYIRRLVPRTVVLGIAVVSVLGLLAAACGDGEKQAPGQAEGATRDARMPIVVPAGEPIVVGISAPLTGPDSVAGTEDHDSALVGIMRWKRASGDQIKGHDIAVRAEDDGCTEADITVQAAERLSRQEGLRASSAPIAVPAPKRPSPSTPQPGSMPSRFNHPVRPRAEPARRRLLFPYRHRNDLAGILAGLFTSELLQAQSVYLVDDGELYGTDLADNAQDVMEAASIAVTRESIQREMVDFSELAAPGSRGRIRTW
jgi:hypothetical protein